MALDKATVAKVATLARIKVPEGELEKMAKELQGILAWIEQLDAVDTAGVEPMTVIDSVLAHIPSLDPTGKRVAAAERDDRVTETNDPARVTGNAPERVGAGEGAFFVVPKVIE